MSSELFYIQATPLEDFVLVQDRTEETPLTVGGIDVTNKDKTLKLVLLSIPTYGALMTLDQQYLQIGSTLTIPWGASRIPITYRSIDEDFFSLPEPSDHAQPDMFEYKLEAYDPRTGTLIGWSGGDSLSAKQEIHVVNVNHPPELLVPQRRVEQTKSLLFNKHVAVISGVEVLDRDKDVNVVRVDIEVESGELTLNEKFRRLAEFESCQYRWGKQWRCVGKGHNDRKMTFLARPSHVKSILTELEYVSLSRYQDDTLQISVFDGVGGECIADYEQTFSSKRFGIQQVRYSSIQDGCYSQRAIVDIVAMSKVNDDTGSVDEPINRATTLGWAIYLIIGLVVFLVVGILLRILIFGLFGRRHRRGAAVGPG